MDLEFHYYITYLIAKKAGYQNDEAKVICYSSQQVDDNTTVIEINKNKATYYSNYISQTMNILKPKKELLRVYPLFHFIPGDPLEKLAWRKDGLLNWLNTTPNSQNANRIIDRALSTKNLYRIGIAIHSFADTWAHQNFIGYYSGFNAMTGLFEKAIPDIGHAPAKHNPDWPGLVWEDARLISSNAPVINKYRFFDAAKIILEKLMKNLEPTVSTVKISESQNQLIADLTECIKEEDHDNSLRQTRIERYINLSQMKEYGELALEKYEEMYWMDEALKHKVRGINDLSKTIISEVDFLKDEFSWKDEDNYKSTHWFQFQEAVKNHQNESWGLLEKNTFANMELEEL